MKYRARPARFLDLDQEAGSAYIYLKPPKCPRRARFLAAEHQLNIADDIILDFSRSGKLLGIEILNPSLLSGLSEPDVISRLRRLGKSVRMIG